MHAMVTFLLAVAALAATPSAANKTPSRVIPGTYFIELHEDADVAGFAHRVKREANARVRRQIDYVPDKAKATAPYKALSIEINDAGKINVVASMEGVVKIHPVEMHSLGGIAPPSDRAKGEKQRSFVGKLSKRQATRRALPETNTTAYPPHVMMQVDKLRSKGITGKGIKIAMIDTGVDYEHPALGGCFGPGCLFSFGADLVNNEPTPKDCNGHGTNAAGIIGARPNPMGFTGAAPGAQLGMYRITCSGEFPSDVMVDAIYRALEEGVDIISSSAGLPGGWPGSLLSSAATRVVESGVVFVQGAGNDGELGLFSQLDPAVGSGVISVGSVHSRVSPELVVEAKYTIGNGSEVPFLFYPTAPSDNFTGTPMEVYALPVNGSGAGNDTHACGPIRDDIPDLSDKLVLLHFRLSPGDCNLWTRVKLVHEKGATRILAYMASEDWTPGLYYLDDFPEGVVGLGMLEFNSAKSMLKALEAGRKVLATAFPYDDAPLVYVETPNEKVAGSVSSFSSWGPSWNLGLKPSLTAVGERIITTSPRDQYISGYEITQGTSFSGPLIAAIVALIGEARGSLDAATIESLLVSHSHPQLYHNRHGFLSYLAPVAQQGGGLARAYDAAYATTLVQPASLSFNDTEHMHTAAPFSFTIKNMGAGVVTYRLSHVPAVTVYTFTQNGTISSYPNKLDTLEVPATITLSDTTVTVAPGNSVNIRVSASAPKSLDPSRMPLWSGWIAINGSDSSSLSVPYQGFSGSIRKHQVLPPDGATLVYRNVSVSEGTTVVLPTPGSITTSQLMLNINATLGTPLVRAEVVPLNSTANATNIATKPIGQLQGFPVQWRPSNLQQSPDLLQFTQFKWNGQLDTGSNVPEGYYKLVVRALRIFGNPSNDEDWDISESPRFQITYCQKRNSSTTVRRRAEKGYN
ncbi:subtilisin-like protease [Metarhizium acridum CQMa 102]|uniref:Subtilisin-like protease n=1 Tax=Metarhizium acridum (strain CQMa 102) TaxID=655827 RepID=E9E8D0_METAQ|nr:subtilisin-like protease [Metarhizium acridum CQMa 102]EFY87880.1 subtilisin-like protease [Metarhizium acridum CQMa 102]